MNDPSRRETAKIYRFPTRLRVAESEDSRQARAVPVRPHVVSVAGSGWYHEAAIQDDARDRKP